MDLTITTILQRKDRVLLGAYADSLTLERRAIEGALRAALASDQGHADDARRHLVQVLAEAGSLNGRDLSDPMAREEIERVRSGVAGHSVQACMVRECLSLATRIMDGGNALRIGEISGSLCVWAGRLDNAARSRAELKLAA